MSANKNSGWYYESIAEPTLSELLDDPLIRLLMISDRVDVPELRTRFAEIAALLKSRKTSEP